MRRAVLLLALGFAASCSNTPIGLPVVSLDRPTAIDFACYGQPLLPAFGNVEVDDRGNIDVLSDLQPLDTSDDDRLPPINRPQPFGACSREVLNREYEAFRQRVLMETNLPESEIPSQSDVESVALGAFRPDVYAFILESEAGTLALARAGSNAAVIQDTDPLTPDRNAISVGELPVDLATDASGCHVTVANAGSCDIANVNVQSVLSVVAESSGAVEVARLPMVNSEGARLAVAPRAIARSPEQQPLGTLARAPSEDEPGQACPDAAQGDVYVALPGCNLVAAIDAGTGIMRAGVSFSGGTPTVVPGNVTCPRQCGFDGDDDVVPPGGADPGGLQPTVVNVTAQGQLLVAAANSNVISIINLGENGRPVAGETFTVALEGDVGVTDLVSTGPINVGGDSGLFGAGMAGEREYIYAIATDKSVRVIDVGSLSECDTQIDPRYLGGINSPLNLSCIAVGTPDFERRAGARGPGIRLPSDIVPTSLQPFRGTVDGRRGEEGIKFLEIDGNTLVGHFMLVGGSDGGVYLVNVDDDLYPDFGSFLLDRVYTSLAVPHQLRDSYTQRGAVREDCQVQNQLEVNTRGPRAQSFVQVFNGQVVSRPNTELLPNVATLGCVEVTDPDGNVINDIEDVPELSFPAPLDVREWAFPDLLSVLDERWAFTYEGLLSRDDGFVPIDGPIARLGGFSRDGDALVLQDNSAPFCASGVEPYDIVNLLGCASGFDCGPGEQCVFSPEAPAGVTNGLCVPEEAADQVEVACRDLLITRRRFSAVDSFADRLTLVPRRAVLEITPVDGCVSDAQCEEFAALAQRITDEVPLADTPPLTEAELEQIRGQYACEPDPSRREGRNWCALRCDDTPDENGFPVDPCDAGQACVNNRCLQAVVPPSECLQALQAYSLAAGESFVAVSGRSTPQQGIENPLAGRTATGYLHPFIADPAPDSNACVLDPEASPLLTGRIRPYDLPECDSEVDDGPPAGANPCLVSNFVNEVAVTEGGETTIEAVVTRAIRFSNPMFTFHLVLPELTLETEGGEVPYSALHPGLGVTFELGGGFSAARAVSPGTLRRATSIRLGPAGKVFVVDEGDTAQSPLFVRGKVLVIAPLFQRQSDNTPDDDTDNPLAFVSFAQGVELR